MHILRLSINITKVVPKNVVLNLYVHLHREGAGSLQSKQLLVMALGQGNGSRGKWEEEDSSDTLYSCVLLDYSQ